MREQSGFEEEEIVMHEAGLGNIRVEIEVEFGGPVGLLWGTQPPKRARRFYRIPQWLLIFSCSVSVCVFLLMRQMGYGHSGSLPLGLQCSCCPSMVELGQVYFI